MHGQNYRAFVFFLFDPIELGRQEIELVIRHYFPFVFLTGNHARIFQGIAEQANDAHEGRV